MSQLGIGAMLHILGGGSAHPSTEYYGQKILEAALSEEKLKLKLSGGKTISIWDNGQSCCESRYMRSDDDVQSLVGHTLTRLETKEAESEDDDYGSHEVCFLEVGTDQCFIVISNHNEHNGYYGGFGMTITEEN